MTPEYKVRYFLEHKVLPVAFYGDGTHLRESFLHDAENTMYQFYQHAEDVEPEYICPYHEEEFTVTIRTYLRENDSCVVLRIGLPSPEAALLCRAVYLCYGAGDDTAFYVTSELSDNGDYYVCGWSNRGKHINFGNAPGNPSDEMDLAAQIFWRMITDGGITKLKSIRIRPGGLS